jgi:hypothetical protein
VTGTSAGWRALRWFLSVLLAFDVVGPLVYVALVHGWHDGVGDDIGSALLLGLSYGIVGLLIASRRPQVPIGWLLLGTGALWSQGAWTVWPRHIAATGGHLDGLAAFVADSNWVPWPVVAVPAIQLTLLLLPDGRLRSPRWRPVAAVTITAMVVATLALMLTPGNNADAGFPQVHHPGIVALKPALVAAIIAAAIALFVVTVANFVGLFREYRRADDVERQQLKWLAVGGCGAVLSLSTGAWTQSTLWSFASGLGLALIPSSIGIAVLRYRLYDLDRLLSRAVAYLLLTGVLAGVYLGIAATSGLVAGGNTIGVAAGTLVAAALFQPLRRRLQHVVDRRFNRARYDASRTVDAFAGRLRDTLSTQSVVEDLLQVTGGVLEPATASVWLRP